MKENKTVILYRRWQETKRLCLENGLTLEEVNYIKDNLRALGYGYNQICNILMICIEKNVQKEKV